MIRRVLAGLALAAFLVAAPAQAAGFGRTEGSAPDPWSFAWSWIVRLWGGEAPENSAPVQKQLPSGGDSNTNSGDPTEPVPGDRGMGIDPDG